MIERAIRNGWDIPESAMRVVPLKMLQIVASGSNREAVNAARVLALLNAQNNVGANVNNMDQRGHAAIALLERIRAIGATRQLGPAAGDPVVITAAGGGESSGHAIEASGVDGEEAGG